uniref:UBE4B factor n=1 Tax=Macrostomum lignano TaxID=282301 RepID=A0A1I8J8D1_9PLAT
QMVVRVPAGRAGSGGGEEPEAGGGAEPDAEAAAAGELYAETGEAADYTSLSEEEAEVEEEPEEEDPEPEILEGALSRGCHPVVDKIFRGFLDGLPTMPSKIVRIFTSSTFTDTGVERNSLMERIYPKIKEYCREQHGLEFQVRKIFKMFLHAGSLSVGLC